MRGLVFVALIRNALQLFHQSAGGVHGRGVLPQTVRRAALGAHLRPAAFAVHQVDLRAVFGAAGKLPINQRGDGFGGQVVYGQLPRKILYERCHVPYLPFCMSQLRLRSKFLSYR